MVVRAKFVCDSVTHTVSGAEVKLHAVTGGSNENEAFFKYTPNAEIKLATINAEAAKQFMPGQDYYVDFVAVSPSLKVA